MANVKKILFASKKMKNGKSPLAVRLTKDRKVKYFFIGHAVRPEDWDPETSTVRPTVPNHRRMNLLLEQQCVAAEKHLIDLENRHQEFTIEQVAKKIRRNNKAVSFTEYAEAYVAGIFKQGKFNVARSEQSRLKNILAFNDGRMLMFHEINVAFLNNFMIYLRSKPLPGKKKKRMSDKTVNNHLLMIRTIFNRAIREELISRDIYPFGGKDKIQLRKVDTLKIGLEKEEVKMLQHLKLEEDSEMWHARNIFLVSFAFAGTRIGDMLKMTWKDIQNWRLQYQMGKTGANVSIPVPDMAKDILLKYRAKATDIHDFIFPYMKDVDIHHPEEWEKKTNSAVSKINKNLKKVAKRAGIFKKISTHISRHTFGNISGDSIPSPMLQKLYRHSSVLTTAAYQGNFIHKDTDEALLKVVNL